MSTRKEGLCVLCDKPEADNCISCNNGFCNNHLSELHRLFLGRAWSGRTYACTNCMLDIKEQLDNFYHLDRYETKEDRGSK